MRAVIIAGGMGTRLGGLTESLPKALVDLGGASVLEVLLTTLRRSGVSRVTLCLGHLADVVERRCEDGSRFGLTVDYVRDSVPLGTAGPLQLLGDWDRPVLVVNGDVLTGIDFRALHTAHEASAAPLTIAVHRHRLKVGLGVVDLDGGYVTAVREKPVLSVDVCAGIYVASPELQRFLLPGEATDMTDIVSELVAVGRPPAAFRFADDWYDIGTREGLAAARDHFAKHRSSYLAEHSRTIALDPPVYSVEQRSPVPAAERLA